MERKNESSARKQILTALIATVPTFTYGIQIGWLSPMGPLLKSESTPANAPFNDNDISWMAAALPLAAICGIPFFSYSSDRYGRKKCVILVSLLSCISWTIKLTAITPSSLIMARVIAGLAAGGCFVVVPVYIKEISEDTLRGALGSLNMTVCKLGVIFVYAVGLTSYEVNQTVYLAVAVVHVVLFCFMPESPNYLLKIGEEKRAAITISWLRGVSRSHQVVTDELVKLKRDQRCFEESPRVTLLSVVRDHGTFSALRMTLVLMAMQTLSGCFALMNYAADVFGRAGTEWSPNTLALLMGSLQLAGSFFTTISIERFGRKIPLACSSLVVSVCMTTLATCFLLGSAAASWLSVAAVCVCILAYGAGLAPVPLVVMAEVFSFQIPLACSSLVVSVCMTTLATCFLLGSAAASWLSVAAVCVCILAYGAGLAPVPLVVMAEVFSFQVRARMAGVSMAFSFFCSSMTVLFYTPVANQFGEFVVFYSFAAVTFLGVVYTVLWVPETKGKSLEEIQKFWRKEEPVFV